MNEIPHPGFDKPEEYETFTTTNDLEEAAKEYSQKVSGGHNYRDLRVGFIAGAKWQAEQLLKSSPLPEDTVLFNKGVEEGKRLMMEEAVEYEVGMHGEPIKITFDKYVQRAKGIFPGDKVRIIVIPNTDEK